MLARQLDGEASHIVKDAIEEMGIEVRTETAIGHCEQTDGKIKIHIQEDECLQADMVVVATGVRPRDELARLSELEVGLRGGVRVDDQMQTSDPNIFGIGECVCHRNVCYGLAAPGFYMAHVLAKNFITGSSRYSFKGFDQSTRLKVAGLEVSVIGDFQGEGDHVVFRKERTYRKIIHTSRKLSGGIFIGQWNELGRAQNLIDARKRIGVWNISRFKKNGFLFKPKNNIPHPIE